MLKVESENLTQIDDPLHKTQERKDQLPEKSVRDTLEHKADNDIKGSMLKAESENLTQIDDPLHKTQERKDQLPEKSDRDTLEHKADNDNKGTKNIQNGDMDPNKESGDPNNDMIVNFMYILRRYLFPNVAPTAFGASRQYSYIFRKMSEEEFADYFETGILCLRTKKRKKFHTSEKWLTESIDHSAVFENKGYTGKTQIAEIKLQKPVLTKFKKEAIPQYASRAKQPLPGQGTPFNIYNTERLGDTGKINLGIKGKENLDFFNKQIVSSRRVTPEGIKKDGPIKTWMKRNKIAACTTSIGIALNVIDIGVSIKNDGRRFGPETLNTTGKIVGGFVGEEMGICIGVRIGAALGFVVPGIGNVIGGFIGGVIGSYAVLSAIRYFRKPPEDKKNKK